MNLEVYVVLWRPRKYSAMCQVVGVCWRGTAAEALIRKDQKYDRMPPREREDYEIHLSRIN